jgi:hypothetical protein
LTTWWNCVRKDNKRLLVLVIREEAEIIALAPFMEVDESLFGFPFTKIELLSMMDYADSPVNCSGALDIIITKRHNDVLAAIMEYFGSRRTGWRYLRFNPIAEQSPTISLLESNTGELGYSFRKHVVFENATVDIPATWEEYSGQLSKNFTKHLRAQHRKIQQEGVVTYEKKCTRAETAIAFNDILDIEQRSWKWNLGVSINSAALGDFYRSFALEASNNGWLTISTMKVGATTIAYDYLVSYAGSVSSLKESYDETYRQYSPGNLLTFEELPSFFDNTTKQFCLLWGDMKSKQRWLAKFEPHYEIFIFKRTFYSRFLETLYFSFHFYTGERTYKEFKNRVARKLKIRLKHSALTRLDQLKQK